MINMCSLWQMYDTIHVPSATPENTELTLARVLQVSSCAATMLGVSQNTIEKQKPRLRNKMLTNCIVCSHIADFTVFIKLLKTKTYELQLKKNKSYNYVLRQKPE